MISCAACNDGYYQKLFPFESCPVLHDPKWAADLRRDPSGQTTTSQELTPPQAPLIVPLSAGSEWRQLLKGKGTVLSACITEWLSPKPRFQHVWGDAVPVLAVRYLLSGKSHYAPNTTPEKANTNCPTRADVGFGPANQPKTIISQITQNQTQLWCRKRQTCHKHRCFDSN